MDDTSISNKIDALAKEEHELFQLELNGHASQTHRARLKELQSLPDDCWDFLRQRRAKREFGLDREDAEMRDKK